jgi:hypothetical protein
MSFLVTTSKLRIFKVSDMVEVVICDEWNGLHALFLTECPDAYYVDCFAQKLQLALVAASREAKYVHQF